MWDPRKFYDDLEHSIFERMLTCGTLLNFMTTSNTLFLLTCETDVHLWRFEELMASQNSMEQEMPCYSSNCNDESFLSLNFLGSEILRRHEHHKLMTLKCGCVTSHRFSCSAYPAAPIWCDWAPCGHPGPTTMAEPNNRLRLTEHCAAATAMTREAPSPPH
jgi:hypothetical protein